MRRYLLPTAAVAIGLLMAGCEGDMPVQMVQRDVDLMRNEVAAVARTGEGTRQFLEDRLRKLEDRLDKSDRARAALEEKLGRLESNLKSQSAKVAQEQQERQTFLQSQAALTVKLDELTTSVRLAQGQTEGMGHGITEANRRVDEFGHRLDQMGQRLNASDKQTVQATAAAQAATTASQQTAQQVTVALQQMAQQTNAAIEQVNATAQLALAEARKTAKEKPMTGSSGSSRAAPRPLSPAVALISPPPVVPPPQASPAPVQEAAPPAPVGRMPESPAPPVHAAKPAVGMESAGELYRNALNDYAKGEYDLAISGFRNHIEMYPTSSLAPNARYWLGEPYYSQKHYDQAIREFALLIKQHPDNPKIASAMLKQGLAYLELGDKSRARTVFDSLLKRFPKSQEARRAKERLSRMK